MTGPVSLSMPGINCEQEPSDGGTMWRQLDDFLGKFDIWQRAARDLSTLDDDDHDRAVTAAEAAMLAAWDLYQNTRRR